jgi:hypothetical protein
MGRIIEPHSSEWFEALQAANVQQAAHTAAIIRLAGRQEVCSICGDRPAPIYRLVKPTPAEESVGSIRLCSDCHKIRNTSGEFFVLAEDVIVL